MERKKVMIGLIILLLCSIIFAFVYTNKKTDDRVTLNSFLHGLDYKIIEKTDICYSNKCDGEYVVLLFDYQKDFMQVADNITKDKWRDKSNYLYEIKKAKIFDKKIIKKYGHYIFDVLTAGYFGESNYLRYNKQKISLFSFSDEKTMSRKKIYSALASNLYYIRNDTSSHYVDKSYNWEGLLKNLKKNQYYLVISISR